MNGKEVISLLFCTASLQPAAAGGWRSPNGSYRPSAGLRVGFLLWWNLGDMVSGLGGRPWWALGKSHHQAQEGGLRRSAAGGIT